MGEQAPAVAHEHAQEVELDRCEMDGLSVDPDQPGGEVDLESVQPHRRLVGGLAGAPQGGLKARHELYVAAARAATLTVLSVDSLGKLKSEVVVPTAPGLRNAVVTYDGTAYLPDSAEGKLLVVPPASRP